MIYKAQQQHKINNLQRWKFFNVCYLFPIIRYLITMTVRFLITIFQDFNRFWASREAPKIANKRDFDKDGATFLRLVSVLVSCYFHVFAGSVSPLFSIVYTFSPFFFNGFCQSQTRQKSDFRQMFSVKYLTENLCSRSNNWPRLYVLGQLFDREHLLDSTLLTRFVTGISN